MRQRGLERPSREEKQSREWHDQCVLRLAGISPRKLLRIIEPSAPEDTPGFSSGFSVFTPDHAGRSRNIVRGANCAIGKYQIAVGGASTGRIFLGRRPDELRLARWVCSSSNWGMSQDLYQWPRRPRAPGCCGSSCRKPSPRNTSIDVLQSDVACTSTKTMIRRKRNFTAR